MIIIIILAIVFWAALVAMPIYKKGPLSIAKLIKKYWQSVSKVWVIENNRLNKD